MPEEEKIQRIFCPHCGSVLIMNRMKDQAPYKTVFQGSCSCGILAILAVKPMPNEPTFTLSFNKYEVAKVPVSVM